MKFRIDPPKGASIFADTPEEAMGEAAKLLMMPSGSYMRFLKFLQDGQIVRWAYGFNEVWITPVRRTLQDLYILWDRFGDTPVSENGLIEGVFLHFAPGTPREAVWHWFESQDRHFVVGDVMQGIRQPVA